jgi:hypothetical protein
MDECDHNLTIDNSLKQHNETLINLKDKLVNSRLNLEMIKFETIFEFSNPEIIIKIDEIKNEINNNKN